MRAPKIDSPCVKLCALDRETGVCSSCLRTIDEIVGWRGMSPQERSRIMADLPLRSQTQVCA